jgi:two-component sensor histidine kinase
MASGGQHSERALILAPLGRDSEIASRLLENANYPALVCRDMALLCAELDRGAAFAVVAEEAIGVDSLMRLEQWVAAQPPWSDLLIVLLTGRGDAPERNRVAQRIQDTLGNVTFLERPFHPTTLVSIARSGLRSRRRQYQARELLERYALLARELQHRTKNLLSVVLSIGSASLRDGGEGRETFFARLHALARAQDLLMQGDAQGAQMRDVVEQVVEGFAERVSIDGPSVFLRPSIAQGFALLIHELATNAAKHGALSTPTGRVSVVWSVEPDLADSALNFRWQERGGPPANPPSQTGFGSILLQHAVANTGKPPSFEYAEEGFTYELTAAHAVAR